MATINQIPMTIMGNIVKNLEPKRTAGGKTVVAFRVAQTSVCLLYTSPSPRDCS